MCHLSLVINAMLRRRPYSLIYFMVLCLLTIVSQAQQSYHEVMSKAAYSGKRIYIRVSAKETDVFDKILLSGLRVDKCFVKQLPSVDTYSALLFSSFIVPQKNELSEQKGKSSGMLNEYKRLLIEVSVNESKVKERMFRSLIKACDYDLKLATEANMLFVDSAEHEKGFYVYRISLPGSSKFYYQSINTERETYFPEVVINEIRKNGKNIMLWFDGYGHKKDYGAFDIERSEDGLYYQKINRVPLVHSWSQYEKNDKKTFYVDSMSNPCKQLYYRVIGISYFGFKGNVSKSTMVKCPDTYIGIPRLEASYSMKEKAVMINWDFADMEDEARTAFFELMSADSITGRYEKIVKLSASDRAYRYNKSKEYAYYKIRAVSNGSDTVYSFSSFVKCPDTIPPLPPGDLNVTVDTSGKVFINWNMNKETDILGYRVFSCNDPGVEEFVELSRILSKDTFFIDIPNCNVISRYKYYVVKAVDRSYNNSGCSEIRKVAVADNLAPVPPRVLSAISVNDAIELNVMKSSSKDIVRYRLKRKEIKSGRIHEREIFPENLLIDSVDLTNDCSYEYMIIAEDSSGNISKSNFAFVYYYSSSNSSCKPIIKKAYLNSEARSIHVSWVSDSGSTIYSYVLYRVKNNDAVQVIKTFQEDELEYDDSLVYPGNEYSYAVKAVLKNGKETPLSEFIKVVF